MSNIVKNTGVVRTRVIRTRKIRMRGSANAAVESGTSQTDADTEVQRAEVAEREGTCSRRAGRARIIRTTSSWKRAQRRLRRTTRRRRTTMWTFFQLMRR